MAKLGRRLKIETPEEMQKILQSYFDTVPSSEWTGTGLALLVGSKQLLDDYQKRPDFSEIITEAKLIIENGYEIDLKKFGRTGTIFALKNYNWKDKTETDITSAGEKISTASVEIPADKVNEIVGRFEEELKKHILDKPAV